MNDESTPLLSSIDAAATSSSPTTPTKSKKIAEPTSEILENMVRVTPAQSSTISFPSTSRYLPVRLETASAANGKTTASSSKKVLPSALAKTGKGGGVLMVFDTQEGEGDDAEFIELEKSLDSVGPAVPAGAAAGGDVEMGEQQPAVVVSVPEVDEGPEREPPASFEVSRCEPPF